MRSGPCYGAISESGLIIGIYEHDEGPAPRPGDLLRLEGFADRVRRRCVRVEGSAIWVQAEVD